MGTKISCMYVVSLRDIFTWCTYVIESLELFQHCFWSIWSSN